MGKKVKNDDLHPIKEVKNAALKSSQNTPSTSSCPPTITIPKDAVGLATGNYDRLTARPKPSSPVKLAKISMDALKTTKPEGKIQKRKKVVRNKNNSSQSSTDQLKAEHSKRNSQRDISAKNRTLTNTGLSMLHASLVDALKHRHTLKHSNVNGEHGMAMTNTGNSNSQLNSVRRIVNGNLENESDSLREDRGESSITKFGNNLVLSRQMKLNKKSSHSLLTSFTPKTPAEKEDFITCSKDNEDWQRGSLSSFFQSKVGPAKSYRASDLASYKLDVLLAQKLRNQFKRDNLDVLRKVIRMLFLIFLIIVVCWCPIAINFIIDKANRFPSIYYVAFTILAWTNSCVNIFVYAGLNEEFRTAYQNLFNSGE